MNSYLLYFSPNRYKINKQGCGLTRKGHENGALVLKKKKNHAQKTSTVFYFLSRAIKIFFKQAQI